MTRPSGGRGLTDVSNTSASSTQKAERVGLHSSLYACHSAASTLRRIPSSRTMWLASPLSHFRVLRVARRGSAGMPANANNGEGRLGERNACARNPLPEASLESRSSTSGLSPKVELSDSCLELLNDNQFSSDAWKNQTAFGSVGMRNGFPPNPSESPNGSFHSPKPHVPAIELPEARARRLKVRVGREGNRPRGRRA